MMMSKRKTVTSLIMDTKTIMSTPIDSKYRKYCSVRIETKIMMSAYPHNDSWCAIGVRPSSGAHACEEAPSSELHTKRMHIVLIMNTVTETSSLFQRSRQ